ncbi:MAG: hypothetical protein M3076_01190 [Actinomycetota bacterium]|nr:hypothetical protein [Actinomycetota bacterium]
MDADPKQIVAGLWRWTAPHPDWPEDGEPGSSDDWPQVVGCVLYETAGWAIFFDPLLPLDTERFWGWADRRCEGRQVAVLTTIGWHRRSRPELVGRYSASTSRAKPNLPRGVESVVVRGAGETMFWLPEHRALIPGDRILGDADVSLRLCPDSWMRYLRTPLTQRELRQRLLGLLDLPVERVLVSHGEPVLRDGSEALAELLGA